MNQDHAILFEHAAPGSHDLKSEPPPMNQLYPQLIKERKINYDDLGKSRIQSHCKGRVSKEVAFMDDNSNSSHDDLRFCTFPVHLFSRCPTLKDNHYRCCTLYYNTSLYYINDYIA